MKIEGCKVGNQSKSENDASGDKLKSGEIIDFSVFLLHASGTHNA